MQKCYQELHICKKDNSQKLQNLGPNNFPQVDYFASAPKHEFCRESIVIFQHGIWMHNVIHLILMFWVFFFHHGKHKKDWRVRPNSPIGLKTQSFFFTWCGIIMPIPWPLIFTPTKLMNTVWEWETSLSYLSVHLVWLNVGIFFFLSSSPCSLRTSARPLVLFGLTEKKLASSDWTHHIWPKFTSS